MGSGYQKPAFLANPKETVRGNPLFSWPEEESRLDQADVDLLIVGGGINGVGIARDAAGRGLSVLLVEKDDLASHTSSASSKLIHGGLRYLEQLKFKLVRESLAERERLLRAAPHIVEPLEFILPLTRSARPAWMIRAGLFLYDHLNGRTQLRGSRSVRLDRNGLGDGLKPSTSHAFSYWDCRVQDSRLVVINAIDAAERGAMITTRTELVEARREGRLWIATLRGAAGEKTVRTGALVNAAGPWVAQLSDRLSSVRRRPSIRLVKGSHIVVPRLYTGEHAFLLQIPDRRVVFAIPFEERFTLVGTTDVDWTGPPAEPIVSESEIDYLLAAIARNFTADMSRDDIVWSYSGIRALYDDGASDPSRVTRDYVLELDASDGEAPLLSVFGGKITTYRRLAERALERLAPFFPAATGAWTKHAVLAGGDIPDMDLAGYSHRLVERYAALPSKLVTRIVRTYGTRTERLLGEVQSVEDLGEHFGGGLHAREVDFLVSEEWACSAEDVLFRRTKLGLHVSAETADRITAYMAGKT
jgi:glycerol-3-phosphate dehydrogenase